MTEQKLKQSVDLQYNSKQSPSKDKSLLSKCINICVQKTKPTNRSPSLRNKIMIENYLRNYPLISTYNYNLPRKSCNLSQNFQFDISKLTKHSICHQKNKSFIVQSKTPKDSHIILPSSKGSYSLQAKSKKLKKLNNKSKEVIHNKNKESKNYKRNDNKKQEDVNMITPLNNEHNCKVAKKIDAYKSKCSLKEVKELNKTLQWRKDNIKKLKKNQSVDCFDSKTRQDFILNLNVNIETGENIPVSSSILILKKNKMLKNILIKHNKENVLQFNKKKVEVKEE